MAWHKLGRVYIPDAQHPLAKSHAQVPVVLHLPEQSRLRVYFASRDEEGRSRPFYIELEDQPPFAQVTPLQGPLLELGGLGTFDDSGIIPSWVIEHQGEIWLYYIGWNVRNTIPYHNSVGLAISRDGGVSFERYSEGPLWDRGVQEPHFSGTSCVLKEDGVWRNWYLSCTKWVSHQGQIEPNYHLKYAESSDGIHWQREGKVAIDFADEAEAGVVKASVLGNSKEGFEMWFAHRNLAGYRSDPANSYRIGYATSSDGVTWTRQTSRVDPAVNVSEQGWDSQMVGYPHVIELNGKRYLFYNGNGFGETGIGVCEWQG